MTLREIDREREHQEMIRLMESFMEHENDPMVGFFWFDGAYLFGVHSVSVNGLKYRKGVQTADKLHRSLWKSEQFRNAAKGIKDHPFKGRYEDTERGRVFWDFDNDEAIIRVGSWFENFPEVEDQIVNEFKLSGVKYRVEYDPHWDLGQGFEGY